MGGHTLYKTKYKHVEDAVKMKEVIQKFFVDYLGTGENFYVDSEEDLLESYLCDGYTEEEKTIITKYFKEHELYEWDLKLEYS